MLSAAQDQGTWPNTEIGRESVVPAGLWLSHAAALALLHSNASFPRFSSPLWAETDPLQPPPAVLP